MYLQTKEELLLVLLELILAQWRQENFLHHLTHSQMTYLRPFQTERIRRRQFQIWWIWQKVLRMYRKHCGKKRNCSLRAISLFPTVFKRRVPQTCKNQGLFWKGLKCCTFVPCFIYWPPHPSFLTHSHTMTPFDAPRKQAFWKHCGKRRNCS